MKNKKTCLHCDPYITGPMHISEKIWSFLFPLVYFFKPLEHALHGSPQLRIAVNRIITHSLFYTLLTLKIFQEKEVDIGDEGLYNRSLVIAHEAKKRGISIRVIKLLGKKGTGLFSIELNGKKEIFDGLPYVEMADVSHIDFSDKGKLKTILQKEKLPHPQGIVCQSYDQALSYVKKKINFPVVIKPVSGSLSRHTVCDINTTGELKEAIRIAKLISREFIVEEFIEGNIYRITMVGGNVVASCLRESPNVIGDGTCTISELVEIKNQHPWRGERHQKNFTLHKIVLSSQTTTLLAQRNIDFQYIPRKGEKVYLHDKIVLSAGADIHDVTDIIHKDNVSLFKKVYTVCSAPVIGIDFIVKDISQPYYTQKCGIIEVNSLPYIDMHHYPVTGTPRNVAGHILDYYISNA